MIHQIAPVTITCDSSGNATVYLGSKIRGYLVSLVYRPGTIVTGADLTITGETTGVPILRKDNLGTGNSFLYPRAKPTVANDLAGGLGTVPSERIPLMNERIKVVVAQGGNGGIGTIEAIYDDGRAV